MNTFLTRKSQLRLRRSKLTNGLRESFNIDINNKWLSLTGVALFWET
ncbi:hypothetical protein [Ancylomarina subtilis]|nr:hypothetical protein [Ancylomarina subtilis]